MKLVASLLVRNELSRYLEPCIDHLLAFCDEIRIVNDNSNDGTDRWLAAHPENGSRIFVTYNSSSTFFTHEGATRNALLDWTFEARPTHVLATDADEFVADGPALRAFIESHPAPVYHLCMEEVWKADPAGLHVREDGGWRSHWVSAVWKAPARRDSKWRIADRKLACGREPRAVYALVNSGGAAETDMSLFHLGWANEATRRARYQRYVVHDGGRFHRSAHLDSIMWTDEKVSLRSIDWPAGLRRWKADLLARAD